MFKRKEDEVLSLLIEHISLVRNTVELLKQSVEAYFDESDEFRKFSFGVHEMEHNADAKKRQIKQKLAAGAFIPIIREDYGRLVEEVDNIADKAEHTSDILTQTRPEIPENVKPFCNQIAAENLKMLDYLIEITHVMKKNAQKAGEMVAEVESKESYVDKLQWDAIDSLFNLDLDNGTKLLIKLFIDTLAGVSDKIELAGDQLGLMLLKKNI